MLNFVVWHVYKANEGYKYHNETSWKLPLTRHSRKEKKTVQQKTNRNWGLGEWEQVKRKFPLVLKYAQSILAGGIVRLEMVLHYRHSMSAGLNLYLF